MKDIKGYIIDHLEQENRFFKNSMTKNKKALQKPYPVSFSVLCDNKIYNEETLDAVFEIIDRDYEPDEKGRGRPMIIDQVFAILENNRKIELPKKYWDNILRKCKNHV